MTPIRASAINQELAATTAKVEAKQQEDFEKVDRRLQQINEDKAHKTRVSIVRKIRLTDTESNTTSPTGR